MAADMIFTKIWSLPTIEGAEETALRTWMPVTHIDKDDNRITAKAPYPIGDYDNSRLSGEECDACNGTGMIDGNNCTECGGTGYRYGNGAIHVDENGVIRLSIDDSIMGISPEGKLYVRQKVIGDNASGLGVKKGDDFDSLYVMVDDSTIIINEDGCLQVANYSAPYAVASNGRITITDPSLHNVNITSCSIVEHVNNVHVNISLDFLSQGYEDANEMTRFKIYFGSNVNECATKSNYYCWDQTVQYTMFHYDAILDVSDVGLNVPLNIYVHKDDMIPVNTVIYWNLTMVSC